MGVFDIWEGWVGLILGGGDSTLNANSPEAQPQRRSEALPTF